MMRELQEQIATVLGMEAFLLGQSGQGSYALSQTQAGSFVNLVYGGVGLVREALQRTLATLYSVNQILDVPSVTNDESDWNPAQDLADTLVKLNQARDAFPPGSEQVNDVLRRAGLPESEVAE